MTQIIHFAKYHTHTHTVLLKEQVGAPNAAHIRAALHVEIPIHSPVITPRVAQDPVILTSFLIRAPANNRHGMVVFIRGARGITVYAIDVIVKGVNDFNRCLQRSGGELRAAAASDESLQACLITVITGHVPRGD